METETKKETAEYTDVESQIIDSPEGEFRIPEGADIDVSVSETPDKKLHITETVTVDEHEYLECEKRWVFLLLMMVGGFFGGFTYSIRGGVFCNAQTDVSTDGNTLMIIVLSLNCVEATGCRFPSSTSKRGARSPGSRCVPTSVTGCPPKVIFQLSITKI